MKIEMNSIGQYVVCSCAAVHPLYRIQDYVPLKGLEYLSNSTQAMLLDQQSVQSEKIVKAVEGITQRVLHGYINRKRWKM